jgi:RNA-directed DNA polymerase
VFGLHAATLSEHLETIYEAEGLEDAVVAFRPIAATHIHVAKAAFNEIRNRKDGCVAVSLDITKFYESVPHAQIKAAWIELLKVHALPIAEYRAFRAITRFTYVEKQTLNSRLLSLRQSTQFPDRRTMKSKICTTSEFRELRSQKDQPSLLITNTRAHGIPQGTALSNVLTNALMLPVDRLMNQRAKALDASYRRYCDDTLIIGSQSAVDELEAMFFKQVEALQMEVHTAFPKRTVATFLRQPDGRLQLEDPNRLMHYLGFTFDGETILLRSTTVSRYYQRMARAVRSAKRKAERAQLDRVPRKKLYARYTKFGDRGPGARKINGERKHRHSFYRYAERCAKIMESPAIMRQLRHHMTVITDRLKRADRQLVAKQRQPNQSDAPGSPNTSSPTRPIASKSS